LRQLRNIIHGKRKILQQITAATPSYQSYVSAMFASLAKELQGKHNILQQFTEATPSYESYVRKKSKV